jgi:HEAT repeat protein
MLVFPVHRLQALARAHVLPWIERFLPRGFAARAQQLSTRAFERISVLFPSIAELVGLRAPAPSVPSAPRVPREAVSATAMPLETKTPEQLVSQLEGAGDWQSRAQAAAALAHVDAPDVLDALVYALRDPSAEVAAAVVDALSAKSGARVGNVLHEVVTNSDGYFSPITRAAAVAALARRGEMAHVFAAVHDLEASVSIAAISAIVEQAPHAAALHLLQVVQDRSGYFLPLTRVAAARALERSGALSPELAEELLATEQDEGVRAVLHGLLPG